MAQKRWTLRILDAKAAHRAWSKRRVMVAIAAAVIAASVVAPVAVRADEVATAPTTPAIEQVVDAKDVAQGTSIKISMTEKRSYRIPFAVENVDVDTLQKMIDEGKVKFSLTRDKGLFDPAAYPNQTLGGPLEDWKTVATKDKRRGLDAPSVNMFKNIEMKAENHDGKANVVLTFDNEMLFGVNGLDNRARSLVRSRMFDYLGTYQLNCEIDGQTISRDVDIRPYDEFNTQDEIDAKLPQLAEKANANGLYAKVEAFGTSAQGREMKALIIAADEKDLEDFQALKKMAMEDPAAVQEKIKSGELNYKVPIFYSNVHADEIAAVDAVMEFANDVAEAKPFDYTRLTGLTDEGKAELKAEMDADGTVWSDLIKDKVTGVGYIRGNDGNGNGVDLGGSRSVSGLNDASADLTDEQFDQYYTQATQTFDSKEILKHVFFVLIPSENVDARSVDVRTNGNGFDLNRDNTYQTQPETKAMAKLISKWSPISLHEVHGYYQQYQIEPCSPTHDPNNEYDLFIDKAMEQGEYFASVSVANNETLNSAQIPMRDYLKRQDDGSVAWDNPFDDMSTSYTPQFAMMHGTNAFTVELPVATSDGVHALEYGFIGNAQFVVENKDELFLNQLERWRRGVENIDSPEIRKYYVSQNDEKGAEADSFRPNDNENHNFFPEYYVIPTGAETQQDRAAAAESIQFLIDNDVKVSRLTKDTKVGDKTYEAGTVVVDMHQAKRNMANCALYPNLVINDWSAGSLYSEPVTNFSAFRGYDMDTVRTAGAFPKESLEQIGEAPKFETSVKGEGVVTIISNNGLDAVRAVNDLLGQGAKVGLVTEGEHEGDYVVSTADFGLVQGKYVLSATQGNKTPKASNIKNDLEVYVPKAYGNTQVSDADGNKGGMVGYNNRLNTNGNWDLFAMAKQMGFKLAGSLDEATVIAGSQYPADADAVAGKIKAGTPYVGYTADALQFVKDAGLAELDYAEEVGWMGFDALTTVEFPEDDIVTATYKAEGDYLMYGYGGNYFVKVPQGAKTLVRTTNDDFVEGFMCQEFIDKYKGQVQAISVVDGDTDMVLFANTLTNKAHQQDDYRYLTASIYSRALDGDFAEVPVPGNPDTPAKPDTKPNPDAKPGTKPGADAKPDTKPGADVKPGAGAKPGAKPGNGSTPQTGDATDNGAGMALAGAVTLALGGTLYYRRRQQN